MFKSLFSFSWRRFFILSKFQSHKIWSSSLKVPSRDSEVQSSECRPVWVGHGWKCIWWILFECLRHFLWLNLISTWKSPPAGAHTHTYPEDGFPVHARDTAVTARPGTHTACVPITLGHHTTISLEAWPLPWDPDPEDGHLLLSRGHQPLPSSTTRESLH